MAMRPIPETRLAPTLGTQGAQLRPAGVPQLEATGVLQQAIAMMGVSMEPVSLGNDRPPRCQRLLAMGLKVGSERRR